MGLWSIEETHRGLKSHRSQSIIYPQNRLMLTAMMIDVSISCFIFSEFGSLPD